MRKPYYQDDWCAIYCGDCREILPQLSGITAVVTDPPYGLKFMGKEWDHGVPGIEFWRLIDDACLPGAPLLAFGGTRTYHRLVCAIEDAGWEIRDCLQWIYGSGFPKSHDISKAIDKAAGVEREVVGRHPDPRHNYPNTDITGGRYIGGDPGKRESGILTAPATEAARLWHGWGTALKPAHEPICVAMKPLDGTFAHNALEHGVAGLNIDGGRIATSDTGAKREHGGKVYEGVAEGYQRPKKSSYTHKTDWHMKPQGRWPANVILTYPEDEYILRDDVTQEEKREVYQWLQENA